MLERPDISWLFITKAVRMLVEIIFGVNFNPALVPMYAKQLLMVI